MMGDCVKKPVKARYGCLCGSVGVCLSVDTCTDICVYIYKVCDVKTRWEKAYDN